MLFHAGARRCTEAARKVTENARISEAIPQRCTEGYKRCREHGNIRCHSKALYKGCCTFPTP